MNISIKKMLMVLIFITAIVGIGGSYYFYSRYQEVTKDPNIEVKKETDALVEAVGKLIELPKDELPTIATISDKEKLVNQLFFVKGENGDKLFAYSVAKIAILYRPSTGKIINVAPITVSDPNVLTQNAKHDDIGHIIRIAYFNGTGTIGKAYLAEKAVQAKYLDTYKTVVVANAAKKDYDGILVIDLGESHSKEAHNLATLLGGNISKLPQGEVAPDADILVISGK